MFVFKKPKDPTNKFDTTVVTIESEAVTLTQVLEDFTDFLRACGYIIDSEAELQIVGSEDEKDV